MSSSRLHRSLGIGAAVVALTPPACHHHARPSAPSVAGSTAVSPEAWSLVVVGGGHVGPEIISRFIELAGGPRAPIVLIPTAVGDSLYTEDCACARILRDAGA